MTEFLGEVWVLENGPLGSMVANYLRTEVANRKLDVEIMDPDIYLVMMGADPRSSTDEQMQDAFLFNREEYSLGGLAVAILHINSLTSLGYAENIANQGVSVLARLPSEENAIRDLDLNEVQTILTKLKIPSVRYEEVSGLLGYEKWVLDQVIQLLAD